MLQSNYRELNSTKFSRRTFILIIGKIIITFSIIIRLLILQVFKAKEYSTLSDKNRIKFLLLQPRRGTIQDATGKSLAHNALTYKVFFYKQKGQSYEDTLIEVFKIVGSSFHQNQTLLKSIKKAQYLQPVAIKDNLSWENIAKIESELYRLPGIYIDKSYTRFYPYKETFAHIIGYIGLPNQEEVSTYKLHHARETKIGKVGIEKHLNHHLIGKFGTKKTEVNASRVIVRNLSTENSIPGNNISLTIHTELQKFLHHLLPQNSTAAAVLEVSTGNILAMCSTPSFDPNLLANNFDETTWKTLLQNKESPLTNKVIGKPYPPASTWKILIALAILEQGISPNERVLCKGYVEIGNHVFKCWKKDGHGYVNLYDAMPQSCNCYFYKMAMRIGIENMTSVAHALGFGQKTGIELPGEVQGVNPNKAWKKKLYGQGWTHGDTINATIGQGYVQATPLQLLTMISRVATGKILYPSLLKDHNRNALAKDLPFDKDNLEVLKKILISCFNNPRGTTYSARILEKQYRMAGKTGTAQVISKDTATDEYYSKKKLRSHSIFVGYAPIHDPKYAAVIVAENAGWGVLTAGPIGRDVLLFAQKNI